MRPALLVAAALVAAFLASAARADCSALAPPSRDTCLRLELGLADAAAENAYETLLSRLDWAARSALETEEGWRAGERRSCLALAQSRRPYTADEAPAAARCIADWQDQASAELQWLTSLEMALPQSGLLPPRPGWEPADYQLLLRSFGRFLLVLWSAEPGDVCADSMLTLWRRDAGPAGWQQIGAARPVTIECPRFSGLLAPDRPDFPDVSLTGEIDRRRTPVTRYFKLSEAGLAPFPLDSAYLGNDSPQFTAVASDEDPIVWAWASSDGVQLPLYYRLRAGKLIEACGEQAEIYRDIAGDASEEEKSAIETAFARLQLGEIEPALAQLADSLDAGRAARLTQAIRRAWPDARAHDCRLAGLWDPPAHRAMSGLAD